MLQSKQEAEMILKIVHVEMNRDKENKNIRIQNAGTKNIVFTALYYFFNLLNKEDEMKNVKRDVNLTIKPLVNQYDVLINNRSLIILNQDLTITLLTLAGYFHHSGYPIAIIDDNKLRYIVDMNYINNVSNLGVFYKRLGMLEYIKFSQ